LSRPIRLQALQARTHYMILSLGCMYTSPLHNPLSQYGWCLVEVS